MILLSGFWKFYSRSVLLPNNEGRAVVYISDLMLANLKFTKTIKFDATFNEIMKIFYQLFTIFTCSNEQKNRKSI